MYVYIVEYLDTRVAFKTVDAAERYIELMYGENENRVVQPTIYPCLMAGE